MKCRRFGLVIVCPHRGVFGDRDVACLFVFSFICLFVSFTDVRVSELYGFADPVQTRLFFSIVGESNQTQKKNKETEDKQITTSVALGSLP